MDGSVVFARLRQCAPHLVHPIGIRTVPVLPPAESLLVYRAPEMSGHALGWFLFALKIALSRVAMMTSSNTWFPGPIQVNIPNSITIGSAAFAGLTVVTDRQTDRQTGRPRYSACSNRPHLGGAAMRPNRLIIIIIKLEGIVHTSA